MTCKCTTGSCSGEEKGYTVSTDNCNMRGRSQILDKIIVSKLTCFRFTEVDNCTVVTLEYYQS